MSKEIDELRREIKQLQVSFQRFIATLSKPVLTHWESLVHADIWTQPVMSVMLQPGQCWTFQSAPTGKLTISNQTADHGSVEFSWGSVTNAGDVQSGEARIIEPQEWPATVCNTGNVQLVVTPA